MAGNTRRLPSWMMPPPPPPQPSVSTDDADVKQPTTKSNRGGRRKVTPTTNGNAAKKRNASKRDPPSSASQASPHALEVTVPIEPSDEDCSQFLTVEDLVSIAEEYVRAADEGESEQGRSVEGECQSRSSALGNDLLGVVTVNKQNSPANPCSLKQNPTTESIPIIVSTTSTGDPAQDMLNLFLGPLLTKPVVDDKR